MRILLLSDIHANLEALDACLANAPSFDRIVNLGDIVGYGASPNEVAKRSRELGKVFVRGNHDKAATGIMDLDDFNPMAAAAAMWTRNELTDENLEWLRALPHGPVSLPDFPDVQLVHGSPNDEDEYVVSLGDALAPLITLTMPLTFFGHTHLQGGFFANGSSADGFRPEYRTVGQAESVPLQLKEFGALSDQSGIGWTTARWRLARGVRSVRHRSADRPLSSHALQLEGSAGPNLRRQSSGTVGYASRLGTGEFGFWVQREIPENFSESRAFCRRFRDVPFWETAGFLRYPPPPPPCEGLDWRGFCKMCLQNLERVRVRGQNLDSTGLAGVSLTSLRTATAVAMICSLDSKRKGRCHIGLSLPVDF